MKFGAIVHKNSLNYGDDVQSIAAMKLLPGVDVLLDREKLSNPDRKEEIRAICNGWYMENPENWPPADNIHPLFISMHITHNHKAHLKLPNKALKSYYEAFEPIGCRDHHTVSLFQKAGIDAYYSGCVTLTLGNSFKRNKISDEIIFADAFNKNLPLDLREKMIDRLVPQSIKDHIVFIKHSHQGDFKKLEDRIEYTEKLLHRYANAHLVVTSRIHVALPCIAMGTPVLFMDVGFNLANSRNRFDGVVDYFNKMNNSSFPFTGIDPVSLFMRKLNLYKVFYPKGSVKYNWENPPLNPVDISPISDTIMQKVEDFLNL